MTGPALAIQGWMRRPAQARAEGWRCICCEAPSAWPWLTCGRWTCEVRPKVWLIKGPAIVRRTLRAVKMA